VGGALEAGSVSVGGLRAAAGAARSPAGQGAPGLGLAPQQQPPTPWPARVVGGPPSMGTGLWHRGGPGLALLVAWPPLRGLRTPGFAKRGQPAHAPSARARAPHMPAHPPPLQRLNHIVRYTPVAARADGGHCRSGVVACGSAITSHSVGPQMHLRQRQRRHEPRRAHSKWRAAQRATVACGMLHVGGTAHTATTDISPARLKGACGGGRRACRNTAVSSQRERNGKSPPLRSIALRASA
jgi:hypothetical protein